MLAYINNFIIYYSSTSRYLPSNKHTHWPTNTTGWQYQKTEHNLLKWQYVCIWLDGTCSKFQFVIHCQRERAEKWPVPKPHCTSLFRTAGSRVPTCSQQSSGTVWPFKTTPTDYRETPVADLNTTVYNKPQKQRSHLYSGGSLISHNLN